MNPNEEMEQALAHQASTWVTVLRGSASREQLAGFAEWLRTSPRHVREFLTMMAIERELQSVDPERRHGAHEAGDSDSSVVLGSFGADRRALADESAAPRRRVRIGWAAAVFISTLAGLAAWQHDRLMGWHQYTTAAGEQRTLELGDGSIVQLNTRSRLKVRLSDSARDIELVSGEALFKVRQDATRPFQVQSGNTVVRALGTEFNVYRRTQDTVVSVLEGSVAVSGDKAVLRAGDEAKVELDGKIAKRGKADLPKALAWRERRLVFDHDSLTDVVREFNRYNDSPQFRLDGEAASLRHYTGSFDADDPESLFQLLRSEPGLAVTRDGDEIVVKVLDGVER